MGEINLGNNDSIVVEIDEEYRQHIASAREHLCPEAVEHNSLAARRAEEPLTLEACMQAFNASEVLDDDNPWKS